MPVSFVGIYVSQGASVYMTLLQEHRIEVFNEASVLIESNSQLTLLVSSCSNTFVTVSAPTVALYMYGASNVRVRGAVVASISGSASTLLVEGTATIPKNAGTVLVNGGGGCVNVDSKNGGGTCAETNETILLPSTSCTPRNNTAIGTLSCNTTEGYDYFYTVNACYVIPDCVLEPVSSAFLVSGWFCFGIAATLLLSLVF
jgi:hypothetical protein